MRRGRVIPRRSNRRKISSAEKLRRQENLKQDRFDHKVSYINHYLNGCVKFVLNNKVVYEFVKANSLCDLCRKYNLDEIDFSSIYTYRNHSAKIVNVLRICHLNLKEKKFIIFPIIIGCSKKTALELEIVQASLKGFSTQPSFQDNGIELCIYDAIGLNDTVKILESKYSQISCKCLNTNRIGYRFFAISIFIYAKNVKFKFSITYKDIWFSTFQVDFSKVIESMLVWFQLINDISDSGAFDLFNEAMFDCKNITIWKRVHNRCHLSESLIKIVEEASIEIFKKVLRYSRLKGEPCKLGNFVRTGARYIFIFDVSFDEKGLPRFVNILNRLGLLEEVLEEATYQVLCNS